jgi:hypothetical protein
MASTDHADLTAVAASLLTDDTRTVFRDVLRTALQQLIEEELTASIRAELHERTESRTAQRNGHRPKLLSTPAGDVELAIPKGPHRQLLSVAAAAAPPHRPGVVGGDHDRLRDRHVHPQGRRPRPSARGGRRHLQGVGIADYYGHLCSMVETEVVHVPLPSREGRGVASHDDHPVLLVEERPDQAHRNAELAPLAGAPRAAHGRRQLDEEERVHDIVAATSCPPPSCGGFGQAERGDDQVLPAASPRYSPCRRRRADGHALQLNDPPAPFRRVGLGC